MTANNNNKKSNNTLWKGIFGGVLGSVIVLTLFLLMGAGEGSIFELNSAHSQEEVVLTDFEESITNVVETASDAVVSVGNYQTQSQTSGNPLLDYYSSQQGIDLSQFNTEPVLAGSGSGVVYKSEGDTAYIVTNNHVIEGADSIEITMADGSITEAELVGSDSLSDLAVLTIPSEFATTVVEFANSDNVQVGQLAIAIGSPLGGEFASSVTQGIVSGLDRSIPVDTNGDGTGDWEMTLMQTDAAINPGNSGGALLNSQGQLIGINSSKFAAASVEGMGFAIPADDVQNITTQLEENGEVARPQLGISMVDLSMIALQSRVEILGLDPEQTNGVVVMEVQEGSAAAEAGIEPFDVIVAIGDQEVTDSQTLRNALYSYSVGDTIQITLLRGGEEQTVDVTLSESVTSSELTETQPAQPMPETQP